MPLNDKAQEHEGERRTSGVQRHGRAAKVVASVLKAAGEELNRVGYANLRIDEVAARAGVNKTTIYRRWPTKAILVSNTLESHYQADRPLLDTGSLRGDFCAYLLAMVTMSKTAMWRGIFTALSGPTEPDVERVAGKLYRLERDYRTRLVQRAVERGELPIKVDAQLIGDMCSAPIFRLFMTFGEPVTEDYINAVVDVTLAGAAASAMRSTKKDNTPDKK